VVFETDARLRPDGEKGLLVNSLKTCEEYYRQRALLWEIQTITRVRAVAGNMEVGQRFQKLAATLANFKQPSMPLAAYSKDWRQQIVRMRYRIETERVAAGKQALAFKTGTGGLVDAEFIAQTLCLAQGWQEGNTMNALERARDEGVIPQPSAGILIENYRKLRRIEGTLRRWSYEGESEFPDDPAPQYRVAVRCGYASVETFFKTVASYRAAIRQVYAQIMGPLPG
jgi:glutamate-ammonia-ligase adenylyltransferase